MTTITGTSPPTTTAQTGNAAGQDQVELNQTFDDFLLLLTTQLQNQDPLSPTDSTEFTNQLVQFSQVEQQIAMNDKLESLISLSGTSGITAALGYIGLDVTYNGNALAYDGDTSPTIDFELPSTARQAELLIRDTAGTIVYRADAPTEAGVHSLIWDGESTGGRDQPAGAYSVEIAAVDSDGNSITVTPQLTGRVEGVETQGNGAIALSLGQGLSITDGDVLAARQPPSR